MKYIWIILVCVCLYLLLDAGWLLASTSGEQMPWDTPFERLLSNIKGRVAPTLGALAIIGFALSAMGSEHTHMGSGAIRIIFGLSVALAVVAFMTAVFGWSGATF